MTTSPTATPGTGERQDLLDALHHHRDLFRFTVRDLSDDAARSRPTVSALSLGGLIKHVTAVEKNWADFVVDGPAPQPDVDWADIDWSNPPEAVRQHQEGFVMLEHETLAGLLAAYDEVAAATDELVRTVDLDARQPLPAAPWFEPGASWSARRVFVHILAETSQHAGHADILRETIDGQKSMG
ncbi:DinB family protein [Nocardioides sp.]|uniref:DinB family protein n=1 Tax=Nocardioides sp. TaxID=35761 RepID=UPI0037842C99